MSNETMTDAQRAEVLFGATTLRPAQHRERPTDFASAADRIFGGSMVTQAEAAAGVREKFRLVEGSPFGPSGKLHISDDHVAHLREGPAPAPQQPQQQPQAKPSEHDQNVAHDLGQTVRELGLDDISAEHVHETATALGLKTPEQVEAVVGMFDKYITAQSEAWREQAEAEFTAADLSHAERAMQYIADEELIDWLAASGMGNHPAMIRAMVKIGKAMRG